MEMSRFCRDFFVLRLVVSKGESVTGVKVSFIVD